MTPTPGSNEDTGLALLVAETVLTWALTSIADKKARWDAWSKFHRMCGVEADKLLIEMKHEARLDWRKPEQKRTPSGMSIAVAEILAEGANQHPEKEKP